MQEITLYVYYVGECFVLSYVYSVGEYTVLGSLCDSIAKDRCICYVQKLRSLTSAI